MKQLKKFLLMLTCIGVLASVTACGSNNDDNGAVKGDGGTDNAATDNTGDAYDNDTNTNDATDGTGDGDGVMDDHWLCQCDSKILHCFPEGFHMLCTQLCKRHTERAAVHPHKCHCLLHRNRIYFAEQLLDQRNCP